MDFRDHAIKKALDQAVGRYRPERTRRSRILRIAAIAALALAVSTAFIGVVNRSTPRKPGHAIDPRPMPVEIVPARSPRP